MSEIGDWLNAIDLDEYAPVFDENGVDVDVLDELSDDDLKELGVKLGHRRRILKVIRDARAPAGKVRPAAAVASAVGRRQITVMFCDLVGSTALSEALDPEDLRNLMADYQKAAGAVVARYDGHVAQYLGDGLMVYFGWPRAHEDDPERAVRAGLEIRDAIKTILSPSPLRVRVGISTGPVVVGETGDGDASVPKAAVGETPNVAARVQSLADADQIMISEATRRLLGDGFEMDSRGDHALKGVAEPVTVYRVAGARSIVSRFEATHSGRLMPMVGRDSEIALLLDRWRRAEDGEGQAVLICGEPGIGKSRLTEAVVEALTDRPHVVLRYQCSPYHTNTAFYPITHSFAQAAGFALGDSPDDKLDKLEAFIAEVGLPVDKIVPVFATSLSIPTGDRYPPLDMSPRRMKRQLVDALSERFMATARNQPVLYIVEDLHWCDPSSLESVTSILDRVEDSRVLAILTHRPEFRPPWTDYGYVSSMALNRFGKRESADLIATVPGGAALPDDVRREITAKTDGIPLFVEEMTKAVLDGAGSSAPGAVIPATLQDSLMARLDRLPAARETAQIGACIGREFSHRLIAAVAGIDDSLLTNVLDQLAETDLLRRQGTPPDATYVFKHGLVQETAYNSLLRSRRQELHDRIADTLRDQFTDVVENEPEVLANHLQLAGRIDAAIDQLAYAAQAEVASAANVEAAAHLTRALELLSGQPEGLARCRRELEFRTALGPALLAAEGWSSHAASENYRRVRELSGEVGDTPDLIKALWGNWLFHASRAEFDSARALVADMLAIAARHDDPGLVLQAHHAAWGGSIWTGELAATADHIACGLKLYDPAAHGGHATIYGGHDPYVCGLGLEGLRLWFQGHPDQALAPSHRGLDQARQLNHMPSVAHALLYAAMLDFYRGDTAAVAARGAEMRTLADDHSLPVYQGVFKGLEGWATARRGDPETGLAMVRAGIDDLAAIGTKVQIPMLMIIGAEIALDMGDLPAAESELLAGHNRVDDAGDLLWKSELHRALANVLAHKPDGMDAAEHHYTAALDLANRQGAVAFELRAAIGYARFRRQHGCAADGHARLAPVYQRFTEGFDTADLAAARDLLGAPPP